MSIRVLSARATECRSSRASSSRAPRYCCTCVGNGQADTHTSKQRSRETDRTGRALEKKRGPERARTRAAEEPKTRRNRSRERQRVGALERSSARRGKQLAPIVGADERWKVPGASRDPSSRDPSRRSAEGAKWPKQSRTGQAERQKWTARRSIRAREQPSTRNYCTCGQSQRRQTTHKTSKQASVSRNGRALDRSSTRAAEWPKTGAAEDWSGRGPKRPKSGAAEVICQIWSGSAGGG